MAMRRLQRTRGLRLVVYGGVVLAAGLTSSENHAAGDSFVPGAPTRHGSGAGLRTLPTLVTNATVRVTRAPRWASEDLADFICRGAQDEFLRSLMPWSASGATGHPQTGTGVMVGAETRMITADTLVGCEDTAQVRFPDGRAGTAHVLGRDPLLNVALLEVKVAGGPVAVAPLGDVAGLTAGSAILVPAWDRNVPPHLFYTRRGKILRIRRAAGSGLFGPQIETDIPAEETEAGAPLLDATGKVVGLIVPPLPSYARGARAVPMDAIQEVLPQLARLGRVPRGWGGLLVQPGTPSLADALGGGYEGEPVVAHVIREGPADRAGIRPGDVVVLFGGVRIRSVEALAEAIATSEIGSMVRVDTLRGSRPHPFSIRVAETPQSGDWPPRSDPLPKLGIHVLPVTPGLRHLWDPRLANGLLVTRVAPAGPGEGAGLEPGDLLRAVNGHALVGRDAIGVAKQALRGGAPALWILQREGLTRLVVAPPHDGVARRRDPADDFLGASRSGFARGR